MGALSLLVAATSSTHGAAASSTPSTQANATTTLYFQHTPEDADQLLHLLQKTTAHEHLLFIGDSTVRNMFLLLARVALGVPRQLQLATALKEPGFKQRFMPPNIDPTILDASSRWNVYGRMSFNTSWGARFTYLKVFLPPLKMDHLVLCVLPSSLQEKDCKKKAMFLAQEKKPTVILWNFGLHLLHILSARRTSAWAIKAGLEYRQLVQNSSKALRRAYPDALLVYRTTNRICEEKLSGNYHQARCDMHCGVMNVSSRAATLGTQCICEHHNARRANSTCSSYFHLTSVADCDVSFMNGAASRSQHEETMMAISAAGDPRLRLLDAYAMTESLCDTCLDGRHYPKKVFAFVDHFIKLVKTHH